MTTDKKTRSRAALNFSDFGDERPKPRPNVTAKVSQKVAAAEGFTSRQKTKPSKIDGRTLRATGRKEQLNIAVKPDTKQEFWETAQEAGFSRGEEFLLAMMESWKRKK